MKLCSAGGLFLLALFTLKRIVRKVLGFRVPRTREPMTIVLPRKLLGSDSESFWNGPKMVFILMTGFYAYSIYKLMRKHHSIKYKVYFLLTNTARSPCQGIFQD